MDIQDYRAVCEAYPLHDRDGFFEFVTGMWLHTRHLVGAPTREEARITLRSVPKDRRELIISRLQFYGQVEVNLPPVGYVMRWEHPR